jgi:hypothetical protein
MTSVYTYLLPGNSLSPQATLGIRLALLKVRDQVSYNDDEHPKRLRIATDRSLARRCSKEIWTLLPGSNF